MRLPLRSRPGASLFSSLSVLGALALSGSASAATFTVSSNYTADTHDDNPGNGVCHDSANKCSLRAAIEEANMLAGWDSVIVPAGTYTLSNAVSPEPAQGPSGLEIQDDMDLSGAGKTATIIDAANSIRRVLYVHNTKGASQQVGLFDLTLKRGNLQNTLGPGWEGAGMLIHGGVLFAMEIAVNDSKSGLHGAGVSASGTFFCDGCTIFNNETLLGTGGGVNDSGGGMWIYDNIGVYIYDSTIEQNRSVRGGGIAGGGYMEMQNCTVAKNTAKGGGGGFRSMTDSAFWRIGYSDIIENEANIIYPSRIEGSGEVNTGGGILAFRGYMELGASVIAKNLDHWPSELTLGQQNPDCASVTGSHLPNTWTFQETIVSNGDNVWGALSDFCGPIDISGWYGGDPYYLYDWWGDRFSPLDPSVGALASNGGSTRTYRPNDGSVLIDFSVMGNYDGNPVFDCPSSDQTGFSRPSSGCDTGSYERGAGGH